MILMPGFTFSGSLSQSNIEINSSIAVNVTDLNHKIVGLEQQLSEVTRTCREFIYLDGSRRDSQSVVTNEPKYPIPKDGSSMRKDGLPVQKDSLSIRNDGSTRREPQRVEAKILYKKAESRYGKSDESDYTTKHNKEIYDDTQNSRDYDETNTKKSKIKERSKVDSRDKHFHMNQNFRKIKSQSSFENIASAYSTSNFNSLSELREVHQSDPVCSGSHKRELTAHRHRRQEKHNEQLKKNMPRNFERRCEDRQVRHSMNRKSKHGANDVDQHFIADIIKKQYEPVKMFGRRESKLSEFSEPMCRDRECSHYENMQDDGDLCYCCYRGCNSSKHRRHSDKSDAKSVCDTRLYSSKINPLLKCRLVHADAYNNSELYDLIPVKEKSSPKTRRKFTQDNLANSANYHIYRELLPSPRTHKPRLNLKAQNYTESNIDFVRQGKSRRISPKRHQKYQEPIETLDSDYSSQIIHTEKNKQRQKLLSKQKQINEEMGTMSSLQYPQQSYIETPNNTVDPALNKTQETVSSTDKTDRALCEIKDILQTFLQEIKKEASSSGKSDISMKITENYVPNKNPQVNTSVMPNSGHIYNHYSAPQCSSAPTPFIPPYPNACCYPVLPMYPMNCMQNGYVLPSQSYTCACANQTEDRQRRKAENKINKNITDNETLASDTDQLIKEIYKFVAQSPTFSRKQEHSGVTENDTRNSFENKVFTCRGTDGNVQVSKHDVIVGTPKIKCFSKSCEAIGSLMGSDLYSGTKATYSDTVLENLSLEATATTSVTELSIKRSGKVKTKHNKFGKVLRSFRLFNKKKKESIQDISESESTIDVEINKKPPFRQEITNYMMQGQEYYRPPPVQEYYRHPQYRHDPIPPFNPAMQNSPTPSVTYPYHDSRMQPQKRPSPHYHSGYPSAPPFTNAYESHNQIQTQVPLCLKEIEVKSMSTQSERKMSFFRKIKQKMQQPVEQTRLHSANNYATQTTTKKPGIWKTLQTKAMEANRMDPLAYSYREQKKIAEGNVKMTNTMLQQMFKRRNPFSPKNLILKTMLGKGKPSFADPTDPRNYRTSMFL
ncbi:Uncharacterized protein OBRU01_15439 [Operophtera brumata]|uniref:Uncharacterized protein n=1 Tax=Operophtera brumata TaxID=104452 RepID=A0A0L7L3A0_OPEBR|nr:Uncharacterized protein OBRU01_15439 [Operophtera brumata]